jgi:hypothetical protein
MSRAQAKAAEGIPKGTSRSTLMSTSPLQMRRLSQWSSEMRTRPSLNTHTNNRCALCLFLTKNFAMVAMAPSSSTAMSLALQDL